MKKKREEEIMNKEKEAKDLQKKYLVRMAHCIKNVMN